MAKPALGRGLENLLGDTQIAGKPDPAPTQGEVTPPVAAGLGLGNLLTAGRNGGDSKLEESPPEPVKGQYKPLSIYKPSRSEPAPESQPASPHRESADQSVYAPRWILLGADALLLALAAWLVYRSPEPLKVWEWLLCAGAVFLGGLLGCLAIMGPPAKKS